MKVINREHIRNGYSYEEYRQLGKDLLSQGKTSGNIQNADYLQYSKLNDHRMDRLDKTVVINEGLAKALKAVRKRQFWVILSEIWCGDAAQNLPIIAKMAALNGRIDIRILMRDENPEIMDAYLTNGGRSIPKLIALDEEQNVLFTWGPRPEGAQKLMEDFKHNGTTDKMAVITEIQKWYNDDATESTQLEFQQILENLNAV